MTKLFDDVINCKICKHSISEGIIIEGIPLHNHCINEFNALKKGLSFKCPKCKGNGKLYEIKSYQDSWGCPVNQQVSKECEICNGDGFTSKRLTPIVQVIGYE